MSVLPLDVADSRSFGAFAESLKTELGRVGLPDDIGGAVALLLSPEANWINGQRIEIAGGVNL